MGDVQPRKRKDKKKKKDDDDIKETPKATATTSTPSSSNTDDLHFHVQNDHSTGGHWCAKIVFFSLLAILGGLVALIILENRGLSDLDTPLSKSRFSEIFDGWVDENREVHDNHDVFETIDELENHDEPFSEEDEHGDDSEEDENEDEDEDEGIEHDEDNTGSEERENTSEEAATSEEEIENTSEQAEDTADDEEDDEKFAEIVESSENHDDDKKEDIVSREKRSVPSESNELDEGLGSEEAEDQPFEEDNDENDFDDAEDKNSAFDECSNKNLQNHSKRSKITKTDIDLDDQECITVAKLEADVNDLIFDLNKLAKTLDRPELVVNGSLKVPLNKTIDEEDDNIDDEDNQFDEEEDNDGDDDKNEQPIEKVIDNDSGEDLHLIKKAQKTETESTESTEIPEEESSSVAVNIIVGLALVVVAHLVLVKRSQPKKSVAAKELPSRNALKAVVEKHSEALSSVPPLVMESLTKALPKVESNGNEMDERALKRRLTLITGESEDGELLRSSEDEEQPPYDDDEDGYDYSNDEEYDYESQVDANILRSPNEDKKIEELLEQNLTSDDSKTPCLPQPPPIAELPRKLEEKITISMNATVLTESPEPLSASYSESPPPQTHTDSSEPGADTDEEHKINPDSDLEYDEYDESEELENDELDDEEGEDEEEEEELEDNDATDEDDNRNVEEDLSEPEVSDVDDSDLMKRLEAKYGRLSVENKSDEDDDADDWTKIPSRTGAQSASFEDDEELRRADDLLHDNAMAAIKIYESTLKTNPKSFRALYGRAKALDRAADKEKSNSMLAEAINAYKNVLTEADMSNEIYQEVAETCISRMRFRGLNLKAVPIHGMLIRRFPGNPHFPNQLAVTYLLMNRLAEAKSVLHETLRQAREDGFALVHYGFVIKLLDKDMNRAAMYLQEGIDSNHPGTQDGRFYFHLGDALTRLGRLDEAKEVYKKGVKQNLFLSEYQRSLHNVKHLRSRPFWTSVQTTYDTALKVLEKNWEIIRGEGLSVLNQDGHFQNETEDLRASGDWKQFELFARGQKNAKNCLRTPLTCKMIEMFPSARHCRRGQVKFSVMHPGTHVWPHCGPTNCRLRAHLGLKIPSGTEIRVAEEKRSWTDGKFLIFDDSFEHEVWHNGTTARLVLIVDIWHPDLTEDERNSLPSI